MPSPKTSRNFLSFSEFAGNEREVEGTLSVQPQAIPVKGFKDYFLDLTPQNNERNPWFTGNIIIQEKNPFPIIALLMLRKFK